MRRGARIIIMAVLAALLLPSPLARAEAAERQDFVIIFGTGGAELTSEAQAVVRLVAARAGEQHPASIAVAGYGDADDGKDTDLANRRAEAVTRALVAAGIAPGLIKEAPRLPPAQATGIPVHKVTVSFAP